MPNVPKGRKPKWMSNPHGDTVSPTTVQRTAVLMVNGVELYKTARHKNTSAKHRIAFPYCYTCGKDGIIKLGDMMDHIIPVNLGGDPWHPHNRQTMCHSCHNIKRGKEAHGHCEAWVMNDEGFKVPKNIRYANKN